MAIGKTTSRDHETERGGAAGALEITETELLTRLNKDGTVNLLNLLVASPKTNAPVADAPPSEPWTVSLDNFQFTKASVTFEDLTRPTAFQSRLFPIEMSVTNLTTRTNSLAGFKFAVTTEASEHLGGKGILSINPVTSGGEVFIENLELTKYRPYVDPFFRGEIASGKLYVSVPFQAELTTNGLSAIISNAPARIENFKVLSPGGEETVVSVPQLAVGGAQANLAERSAKIALLRTSGGSILVRRQKNGDLNLMDLLPASPAETGTVESAPAAETKTTNAAWAAAIVEIAVEDYSIRLEDLGPTSTSLTEVDQFKLNLKGVSLAAKEPIATHLSLRLNESGLVRAAGSVALDPLSTEMNISVTNLDLRALQPYLQDHARLELSGGTFNLTTRAKWEAVENSPGKLLAEGGFSIADFNTRDLLSNPLVGWTNLSVEGFKMEMPPERLQIEAIRWDGLSANLMIRSNKQANFAEVMIVSTNAVVAVTEGDAGLEAPAKKEAKTPFPVTVGVFAMTNASIRFADASIQPASALEIQQFGGTITGLSSDSNATADVNLGGSFGEQAPFTIVGNINPLAAEPRLDLTISNRNMQLAPLTPYMEKFAGHPLNKGRLSLALRYAISGQELKAENHVQIDQLTLGPRNNSPDATKLPVKLAVALLKDSSGKIDLDVPVKGRLDDPEFRVGPIILKVVMNMITKAAASPFKLLGAAVGGGEELSFLEFRPGTAELVEGETNKIEKLIKALAERELNVEIDSSIDPLRDRDALARQLVQEKIKQLRLKELEEMGQKPATPETFEIEPVENQRLLRAAVVEQFGTNVTVALQEMLAKEPETGNETGGDEVAEVRKVKWYEILKVPFQKKNSPEAIARRQAKADAELLEKNPALGSLTAPTMVKLLASRTEVTPDHFLKLMQERGEAANGHLLTAGLSQDRVLLVAPKPVGEGFSGEARVNLSVN